MAPKSPGREEKSSKKSDSEIVVFSLLTPTQCGECGKALEKGDFLRQEGDKGLCMECADLGHLWFLPRGDAALTRRARKYSRLSAVVLRWSRARKQYERRGLLLEEEAIDTAEIECAVDADQRADRAQRRRERETELDKTYVKRFAESIGRLFPGCPPKEAHQIAEHTCRRNSGRVGRSSAAKTFDEEMITLAVQAHVRHVHTPYDLLLLKGKDRREAREEAASDVLEKMQEWRAAPPR